MSTGLAYDTFDDDCDEDISDWDDDNDDDNNGETQLKSSGGTPSNEIDDDTKTMPSTPALGGVKPDQLFQCYSVHQLLSVMQSSVKDIAATLSISAEMASLLLRRHQWKKDRLLDRYLIDSDSLMRQYLCHHTSVVPPTSTTDADTDAAGDAAGDGKQLMIECPICVEDVPTQVTLALGCNHRFCIDCWRDYIVSNIRNKSDLCVMMTCAGHKCGVPIMDSFIRKLISGNDWNRYESFLVQSFVMSDGGNAYKYCPTAGCQSIVKRNDDRRATDEAEAETETELFVLCECGLDFCFNCLEERHAPATCRQLSEWTEKCSKECENAKWIISNTKKCPKCYARIEKTMGCNHMVCTKCTHEFCWVCMGDWTNHGNHTGGFYRCNQYKPKLQHLKADKTDPKQELDKYVHYYNRYYNHHQSKLFLQSNAHKVTARMRLRFEAEQTKTDNNNESSWIDVEFLKNAHNQIFKCRQLLKYTYVFGYYLSDGAEKDLFEFLQTDLEKNTELLNELCEERDLRNINAAAIRNYTNITHHFADKLIEGIRSGLTNS